MMSRPLLTVRDLVTTFPAKGTRAGGNEIRAVDGVSLDIAAGSTLGLVGESGCGKSTLARTIVGLEKPKSGTVTFDGQDLTQLSRQSFNELRRDIQMVFQDPYASLYPRMTVRQIVSEGWKVHRGVMPRDAWDGEVDRLLETVGLGPEHADRYPHQFSGGQRQRISIARALALRPKLIVCDEVTSALDVSVQAQLLNLMNELQEELGVAYLFISHDLSVVRHISHDVAVMYLGEIVESGEREQIFGSPSHPYTQALLSSAPTMRPWHRHDRRRIVLEGDLPSAVNPPSGCRFRTRCWKAEDVCVEENPKLEPRGLDHPTACHFAQPDSSVVPKRTA